ncbi:hypothetical protein [Rhodopirellula sp. MGV]|uniref:hypothetical protein n=1 Tax=Rhodopirellula sp. MGV TaxID=2023130 RepID=UPI000B974180|nr:hypothetical protein [Rhodopirellula sp. MGV]OYP37139.1 hypothetical protein CGZ80_06015 [Rhodopirellula sp. MGV]PNY35631.1 hypothetical protein C2E31_17145 [Rhodopirellula baltica]
MNDETERKSLHVGYLTANQIFLVDAAGKERAALLCSASNDQEPGYAAFQLLDANGTPRVELQVDTEGCCIRLNKPGNVHGVSIAFSEDRGVGILISGHEGKSAINLEIPHPNSNDHPGQRPELQLVHGDAERTLSMEGLSEDVEP